MTWNALTMMGQRARWKDLTFSKFSYPKLASSNRGQKQCKKCLGYRHYPKSCTFQPREEMEDQHRDEDEKDLNEGKTEEDGEGESDRDEEEAEEGESDGNEGHSEEDEGESEEGESEEDEGEAGEGGTEQESTFSLIDRALKNSKFPPNGLY